MWNFKYTAQYLACVADLEAHPDVQSMRFLPQHAKGVSTYDHCCLVAYSSFRICAALGLDARSAARGGLLHDFFLYNWQTSSRPGCDHAFNHPLYALANAEARFDLNDTERDIIATHMWPLPLHRFYRCWESLVVSCMDKVCALAELMGLVPLLTRGGRIPAPVPVYPSVPEVTAAAKAG